MRDLKARPSDPDNEALLLVGRRGGGGLLTENARFLSCVKEFEFAERKGGDGCKRECLPIGEEPAEWTGGR